jgi:prolyl-tRNA synthetase
MKRSSAFIKTYKETPADSDSINASLLIRGGFIQKEMAGVYALLPLGMKVYQKIENIIREELNNIGGEEILLNVLQPRELWDKTGRWMKMDDILYKMKDQRGVEIALGPTHEEEVTEIAKSMISSYKYLPRYLYQIQVKFRNELRAKSGLLRGREFIMKDLYSFHNDENDFEKYYEIVKSAYTKIFSRLGLKTKIVEASGGVFSKISHEFQVLSNGGEDSIFYCDSCDYAINKEISEVSNGDKCPKCEGKIVETKSIEVGNIFPLKDKFARDLDLKYKDENGKEKYPLMGCYGIGLTRAMGAIVEVSNDKRGIIWPENVSPYKVNLISIDKNEEAEKIYNQLKSNNIEILYDDRDDITAGEKFADTDLIGCPIRIIVSEKSLKAGGAELSKRGKNDQDIVKLDNIVSIIADDK